MLDDRLPGEHPNRGWNRASIIFWSRRPYRPRIDASELRLLRGIAGLRLLAVCAALSLCLSMFCVWMPLFMVSIVVGMSTASFALAFGGAVTALTLLLFLNATRVTRREREFTAQLQ